MAKKMFARGYTASRKEKERQDKARENMGKRLWKFFITADSKGNAVEADVHFLTEEPVNFYEHNIKNGDKYESYTCTNEDCPYCADGNRPTYRGAYLVVDRREFEYTDNNGKKQKGKNQVRLFVQGMKVVSQLDRLSNKYGLTTHEVTIVRLGSGTQTTYTVEVGEKRTLSTKEIEQYLPEKLRDSYDGTEESLMSIVEEQLMMMTPDYNEEEEDDEDDETSSRDKLIHYDDGDELPFDEGDEEEEEEKPRKLFKKSKSPRAKKLLK